MKTKFETRGKAIKQTGMAYLGSVEHYKDPDFYLGGGMGLALGALAIFALKWKGKI